MTGQPEVVAIYFPSYHPDDHYSAWYGEGWTEWELVKTTSPLFEGHQQPKIPLWGYFDESDPSWSAREIDLAADFGVTAFMFDWYWYSGVQILHDALEKGFLKAPNRSRLKFFIMWANHDWWDFPAVKSNFTMANRPAWLHIHHSLADMDRVIDYCLEHYFSEPNYLKMDGKPVFAIWNPPEIARQLGGISGVREALNRMDDRARRSGLRGIYFIANIAGQEGNPRWDTYCWRPDIIPELRQAGFDGVFGYNIVRTPDYPNLPNERPLVPYEDVIKSHLYIWENCEGRGLPFFPVATIGCDVSPRWRRDAHFPMDFRALGREPVIVGNTPERFGELCRLALKHLKESASEPKVMFINAWNEWTEGMYLLPEKQYGKGYLEALRSALASEYKIKLPGKKAEL